MEWQEFYSNTNGTFTKSEKIRLKLPFRELTQQLNLIYFDLTYLKDSEIIGSCGNK
jgi:hypothetical protein